jgi:hypothetical protein
MKSLVAILVASGLLLACNDNAEKQAAAQKARQQTIDSLNLVLAKQKAVDSMQRINDSLETARAKSVEKNTHSSARATGAREANTQAGGGEMSTTTSQAAKKKGWSHTAKGAVVGAGTGAITGAIINKEHPGQGAIIGTVIGGAVGAGTGLIVDKSVKKKKKKAAAANQ